MGIRTEHYTLVPQYGGTLRLPSVRLSWFNIRTGTIEHASLPIKTLAAGGAEASPERYMNDDKPSRLFPKGYTSGFWLPLLGVFLLLTGYWIGVWYKGRGSRAAPLYRTLGVTARTLLVGAATGMRQVARRLSLLPRWNRAWARAADLLPTSVRFWFWVRCANLERDPALWRKTLQFLSCRQLELSPYASLPELAEKLIQFQPSAQPEEVRRLLRGLDGAIYGKLTLDFERWKQDFEQQVRPSLLSLGGQALTRRKRQRLPALNPKAA
jgi:hypothetical protein